LTVYTQKKESKDGRQVDERNAMINENARLKPQIRKSIEQYFINTLNIRKNKSHSGSVN